MAGFSLNGIHSSEFDIVVRKLTRSIKPAKRVNQQQIPGRHGTYDVTDDSFDNLLITAECTIGGRDLDTTIHAIAAWLNRGGQLEIDTDPGRFYRAKVWSDIQTDRFGYVCEFTVIFDCYPLAQSAPHQIDVVLTESGQSVEVTTTGNFETPCVINIINTGTKPITNIILEYRKEL